jgi:hypothetical protein
VKIEWTNIRDYRKVGGYEYATVDVTIRGLFGIVLKRRTERIYRANGRGELWKNIENGYPKTNSSAISCLLEAHLVRENLMNAEIAEAEAKRAEQDREALCEKCKASLDRYVSMQHVVPTNDTREHNTFGPCWCNPEIRDGVVIHNSADGREKDEEAAELAQVQK